MSQPPEEMKPAGNDGEAFKPCAFADGGGSLYIINKDCSQTHEAVPGTNFELVRDTQSGEVIGVVIHMWGDYKKDLV